MSTLNARELSFFRDNGFIIRRGVFDRETCDKAVDIAWRHLPKAFRRDDPKSWRGRVSGDCIGELGVLRRRGKVKLREHIRGEATLHRLLAGEDVAGVLRDLLGPDYFYPEIRGLYPIFPVPRSASIPLPGHVEGHPLQLCVIAYLSDVSEDGGCLHVWPGSHIPMYRAFPTKLLVQPTHESVRLLKHYNRRAPTRLGGRKGDAIFFHHRLVHTAGLNHTRRVRMALICDFVQGNVAELLEQESRQDTWEDWPLLRDLSDTGRSQAIGPKFSVPRALQSVAQDTWSMMRLPPIFGRNNIHCHVDPREAARSIRGFAVDRTPYEKKLIQAARDHHRKPLRQAAEATAS